jgi:hypothetical protein
VRVDSSFLLPNPFVYAIVLFVKWVGLVLRFGVWQHYWQIGWWDGEVPEEFFELGHDCSTWGVSSGLLVDCTRHWYICVRDRVIQRRVAALKCIRTGGLCSPDGHPCTA